MWKYFTDKKKYYIFALVEAKSKKECTNKMYEDVRHEYKKMSDIKCHGVSKYSHDYIVVVLANRFYRSPKTIENIIFNRV